MASLLIQDVWKKYGEFLALQDINLDIADGEFIVLVGPSGCGKSTLLSIIAGLEESSYGTLHLGARDVTALSAKDRDIAMVFQTYALYPTMTVRRNITFGMENRGVPKDVQARAVADAAKLLQIEPLLERKPSQLSGGQRQRVAMGRALVRDPSLFLFDEPLSNLDAKLRVEMRTEIKKLHQRLGQTIVYVTHDQVEAMTLSDRIVVMNGGVIQQFADPDTIYRKPANMFVAGFMGSPSMNFLDVTVQGEPGALEIGFHGSTEDIVFPLGGRHSELAPWVGGQVVLGLRPEDFVLPELMADGDASIPAMVEVVEPTGPDTMVVFLVGGQETIATMPASFRPHEGDHVRLGVRLDHACFFDPETEQRIRGIDE